jgi:UDPglucose 6-dehydrogenase
MNVAVLGLWHLGAVTAAGAAAAGHDVAAWDPDAGVVARLARAEPPVAEPGLPELVAAGLASGKLRIAENLRAAVADATVVWITFDTPVDDEDRADVGYVVGQIAAALEFVRADAVILVSSQVPVGTARQLESECARRRAGSAISFACSPENLRLGKAIAVFTAPDRVVIGARTPQARDVLAALWAPITDRIEWMSVESAEMTKHAVNAFLATSVTFINELAAVAERYGADAREVERGLKTERRIGPSAYLSPGGAFAGGTLARDVNFVRDLADRIGLETPFFDGIVVSNDAHRGWARRRLVHELGPIAGKTIAVWGLTYKPGTDTLRRSEAITLCRFLIAGNARIAVHDPAVRELPEDLRGQCRRADDPIDAARGADALVVATEWPAYRAVDADALAAAMPARLILAEAMPTRLILDANRFLGPVVGADRRFRLLSVGQP